jgi:gamma-glutamylcyclotransferase (GGCT)/AIG2-like uncharacterized protein YtfP
MTDKMTVDQLQQLVNFPLFVYGSLMPKTPEEIESGGWVSTNTNGVLYYLNGVASCPGLVQQGINPSLRVHGFVKPVPIEKLLILDQMELMSGYARALVTITVKPYRAYAYVYVRNVDENDLGVPHGRWTIEGAWQATAAYNDIFDEDDDVEDDLWAEEEAMGAWEAN